MFQKPMIYKDRTTSEFKKFEIQNLNRNMKRQIILAATLFIFGCNEPSTFINHTLQSEKLGNCSLQKAAPNMNSNTSGERYIFDYCVEDGFDGKNYKVDS